ncbi:hypothetical protein [Paraburkholderia sp.]|uniref:hypothetical protein n=1 Tax=Paraburkholderia sp. TaxID=1926495 RepID=UPI00239B2624|nr:hypothetical protein [Paraburkholderia sp.]MDE1183037.1 hypothetical protein [Paraburkholderia sp.]
MVDEPGFETASSSARGVGWTGAKRSPMVAMLLGVLLIVGLHGAARAATVTAAAAAATPDSAFRCTPIAASGAAPAAQGEAIEADAIDSDGTRLYARGVTIPLAITTRPTRDDTVVWEIRDSWNKTQASGRFDVPRGAGKRILNCTGTLAGYFALSASYAQSGGELPQRGTRPAGIVTFGVLPQLNAVLPPVRFPQADLHRFGGQGTAYIAPGQHCCGGDGLRPVYTNLGLSWANDHRNWNVEEPDHANTFDPAKKQLDAYFRTPDIMRLILVDGIPKWAAPEGKETHSYAPVSLDAMREYMTRVGTESVQVRTKYFPAQAHNYYQVTWEPDPAGGLPWRDTDANFVAMYAAVWQGLHATDRSAVVMGLTYSSVGENVKWLNHFGPLGIGKYLDGLTIHGYYDFGNSPSHPPERTIDSPNPKEASEAIPTAMRALRRQMAEYLKPGAKLFVTELGISYDIGTAYAPHYPTADVLKAQAAIVARAHLMLLGEGADLTYVFYAADMPENVPGYGVFFDLTNPRGMYGSTAISPKPAALAVAAMTRVIDGTSTLGALKNLPKGVFGYAFQRLGNGKVVTALWTWDAAKWNAKTGFDTDTTTPLNLNVDAPGKSGEVAVIDMMGNPSTVAYRDGVLSLPVSASPVYVISPNPTVMKANATAPLGYTGR